MAPLEPCLEEAVSELKITPPASDYVPAKDFRNDDLQRSSTRASSDSSSTVISRLSSEPSDPLAAAKMAALASPCFFHRRIDDAVNIEKILEEVSRDDTMSHSRLVQTATGVREVARQLQRRPMKRAVRSIMIVTKARDNNLVVLTRELTEWLLRTPRYGSSVGVTVYVDEKLRTSKRFNAPDLLAQNPRFEGMLRYWTSDLCWSSPEKFDLVLTLGGDGTVLFTSWMFQRIVPPVLSFSLGSLGFLTPFDFASYRDHLNQVMGGMHPQRKLSHTNTISTLNLDYDKEARPRSTTSSTGSSTPSSNDIIHDAGTRVNLRMRFTCTVYRASPKGIKRYPNTPTHTESSSFEVLNELVIDRGPSPYVSNLELYGGDDATATTLLTVIQADGVIFSTPTGSTAYSLSAGGALVQPDIPAILLTPICPHTLSFRPMLLNDTMALRVAVPRNSRATAWCSFDGKGRVELRQGDFVNIAASRYPFPVVEGCRGRERWIDSVSRTLRWNTRGARQKGWSSTSHGAARGGGSVGLTTDEGEGEEYVGEEDDDAEATGEDEEFDIDFDEEDESADSNKDSGYGGEMRSRSPTRKAASEGSTAL